MNPKDAPNSSEIPVEIDFSSGTRGKFFQQNAVLNLRVDLDTKTQDSRLSIVNEKGVKVSAPTNEGLK
jgi:hypothetical protein